MTDNRKENRYMCNVIRVVGGAFSSLGLIMSAIYIFGEKFYGNTVLFVLCSVAACAISALVECVNEELLLRKFILMVINREIDIEFEKEDL